jgi:hypothetical protein
LHNNSNTSGIECFYIAHAFVLSSLFIHKRLHQYTEREREAQHQSSLLKAIAKPK